MKASQLRHFPQAQVVAGAMLAGSEDSEFLEMDPQGYILGLKNPAGFHLVAAVRELGRTFVVQKNVGTEGGSYENRALAEFKDFVPGFKAVVMRDPIEVLRAGQNVWTGWHKNQAINRLDCYHLTDHGMLILFQVGIYTHDNGKSFRLHGEPRWLGRLYKSGNGLVGIPVNPKWGSFNGGSSNRNQIFQHPEFQALVKSAKLEEWKGSDVEIDPPLPTAPEGKYAVMQWYITFAGQTGQGPCTMHDGSIAWVHGIEIFGLVPDPDGEIRLWRGDIISYQGKAENWGHKKNGPPKLTGVRLVGRA